MIPSLITAPLHDLANPPKEQNPSLDFLRTLAILGVIAGHSNTTYLLTGAGPTLWSRSPFVKGGWSGVDLFFALSGYLIGRQLWREVAKTGSVNIKRFMIRRGLRIWPLYFVVLLITIFVVHPELCSFSQCWGDLFFVSNYTGAGVVDGGWSLCIEEQFYIFAPLLLVLTAKRFKSVASYRPWLLALLVLLPAIRAFAWWRLTSQAPDPSPEDRLGALYYPFHSHSDGLVIGMLVANLENTGSLKRGVGFLGSIWLLPLAVILCGVCYSVSSIYFNYTGFALVFGSAIVLCLTRPESVPSFIGWRIFYWISRLSYGMYLVHQWFRPTVTHVLDTYVLPAKSAPLLFSFLNFASLAAVGMFVAFFFYCVVEHPFLALRERILHPRPKKVDPIDAGVMS